MTIPFTESTYDHLLHDLCVQEEILTQELEVVRKKLQTTRDFKDLFEAWCVEKSPGPTTGGRHGHIEPHDIAHCPTQQEALKYIARLSGGLVNPTEAASLVLAAGLSNGKRSSVVSTLSGYLSKGDAWEWMDAGVYRLRDFTPMEEEKSDQADQTESLEPTITPIPQTPLLPIIPVPSSHSDGFPWSEPMADASSDMPEVA